MNKKELQQLIKEEIAGSLNPSKFFQLMGKRKQNRRNKMSKLGIE
jgi:hypothetical protein